jgi:dTDP-glucose 4,6-dehydratase
MAQPCLGIQGSRRVIKVKVLITGVGGFIGSNLAAAHLAHGDEVIGIDNFSTGNHENLKDLGELKLFDGGVTDSLDKVQEDINIAYHFASPASPEKYMALAMNTMEVNTSGTLAMLQYSLRTGARLVFASTSEIYGDPLVSPQSEDYWGNVNPIGPRSVYDEAKRFGETLVAHFKREHNINVGIVRIFNTYGPKMDPYDGRVVSTFIRQALKNEPFTIFGDGSQTRSFCYIDDLVRGIISMGAGNHPGPINLGNPRENTLLELAKLVTEIVGGSGEIKFLDLPEDDPKTRNPDITRARTILDWEPSVSLEVGIKKTASWIADHLSA